jgi:hypothetical protein
MPTDAKGKDRRQQHGGYAMVTHNLHIVWSEPTDSLITDDLPLLLTKLSRIPAVPDTKT